MADRLQINVVDIDPSKPPPQSASESITTSTSKESDHIVSKTTHTPHTPNKRPKKRSCTLWSRKSPNKVHLFIYNFIMPFTVIASAAYFAFCFKLPFIFPSLGPTAFLHFAIPDKAPSSPKNTLIAHFIGILSGSFSLQVTGLYNHDVIFVEGVVINRIFCAAMSVAITCCLMVLCKVAHPPSGATTLIVSLGILKTPTQLAVMMAAVAMITIEAFVLNRIFRTDAIYPIWSVPTDDKMESKADADNFDILKGLSSLNLSRMNMKYNKLNRYMAKLSVDNFLDCFEICTEIEDEDVMGKLIEFATNNRDLLNEMDDYHKNVPYAVRVTVDNYSPSVLQYVSSLKNKSFKP